MLFCVLVGTGAQLLCMGLVTIAFAAIGSVQHNATVLVWLQMKNCEYVVNLLENLLCDTPARF